jgi:antagonist of KipI
MGYRLEGPELKLSQPRQMISESVVFGTIQVPVSGQAIILLADRQTTGGYPKIAYVASIDQPLLAQMLPGDAFNFSLIDIAEAQKLDLKREQAFDALERQLEPIRRLLQEACKSSTPDSEIENNQEDNQCMT